MRRMRAPGAIKLSLVFIGTGVASAWFADSTASDASGTLMYEAMMICPQAVCSERFDTTYLVYHGPGFDPYITAYNQTNRRWLATYNPSAVIGHALEAVHTLERPVIASGATFAAVPGGSARRALQRSCGAHSARPSAVGLRRSSAPGDARCGSLHPRRAGRRRPERREPFRVGAHGCRSAMVHSYLSCEDLL